MKHNHPKIEILDTTLRDGEQTSGVSFVPHEKLMIARLLLEDLKVDRVEVASARVSEGEFDAVKMICDWAARRNMLPKVEVLGFVDGHGSECLLGRLEQRHERFARICLSIDGCADPDQHKALYAARHIGRAEPVAGH